MAAAAATAFKSSVLQAMEPEGLCEDKDVVGNESQDLKPSRDPSGKRGSRVGMIITFIKLKSKSNLSTPDKAPRTTSKPSEKKMCQEKKRRSIETMLSTGAKDVKEQTGSLNKANRLRTIHCPTRGRRIEQDTLGSVTLFDLVAPEKKSNPHGSLITHKTSTTYATSAYDHTTRYGSSNGIDDQITLWKASR
mmetsp:Transcript_15683/g.33141  ORF Transcript_15683/g.33141 Transcript_15683/m.33141 type:complete len:192 (+) Transcript_15683:633-1208(+)|eukprot:CAMPEP_0183732050 /NCGR_PEP_ID=MMETSP0737-20130205/37332_1 /TAXON_ID=385413 /ORGANISM="Thalassiosira miniscula, Strain CCMP1093" /LENGTH=191 /DNA_ID=CAMNT_0025964947 /DNA_START=615 /DNA_END=1190 /DNA_ORIENTATION=-